jgi:16S rRNA A1518/A1519 N6-dimethyltransferase RsmA/KsgA/DIM1 with predicted DNA glycosylase/AP lyase activity
VFERLTCTIQREVGERLGAQPRTEGYGPVSVITQTLADIQPLAILPPTAFWPRPQVESLMVTLRPRPRERIEVDDIPGFVALVQTAFQQRRKMLRRLLRESDDLAGLRRDRGAPRRLQALRDADDLPALRRDEGAPRQRPALRDADDLAALQAFARAGVSPEARPEELSPADWRAWFRSVQAARSP